MTIRSLEAVLRRALTALQIAAPTSYPDQGQYSAFYAKKEHDDTIAALQAVLAEPVAWVHTNGTSDTKWHPPQRPAEPVQEPVAWIQPDHLQKARRAPFLCRVEPTQRCADFVPLYTSPPQRKPLTEEEIDELSRTMVKGDKSVNWLCRAIERTHGIEE